MPARLRAVRAATALAVCLLLCTLGARPAGAAAFEVSLELQNEATVSDVTTVVARASTDDEGGIQKVEFYVDGKLRASDQSIPYSFDWDTLEETEGPHKVRAVAYDANGATREAEVTVKVDNGLTKSADEHADAALAALKAGNLDEAARLCRRALKVDPGNLRAARALAGIYRARGDIPAALAILEKASIPAGDTEARAELVALHIQKGGAADTTEEFLKEAAAAVDVYRKLQDARLAAAPAGNDPAAAIRRGDILADTGRWEDAAREYARAGTPLDAPVEAGNRYVLAQIHLGHTRPTQAGLRAINLARKADDATKVVTALAYFAAQQPKQAGDAVRDAALNKALPALVVSAYADLAAGQRKRAQATIDQLTALAPGTPEVEVLRSYVLTDALDISRALIGALQRNPTLPEPYVVYAYQMMMGRDPKRFSRAEAIIDLALQLDPQNDFAIMGKVVALLNQDRAADATPLLTTMAERQKSAGDVLIAQAMVASANNDPMRVSELLKAAMAVDSERWNDVFVPKPLEFVFRVYRERVSPVLSPAMLYPAKPGE